MSDQSIHSNEIQSRRSFSFSLKGARERITLLIALLSPIVFIEPAPVDLAIITLFGLAITSGLSRQISLMAFFVTVHITFVVLAVLVSASQTGALLAYDWKYLATQTYLSLGFLALYSNFSSNPRLSERFSAYWMLAAIGTYLIVIILHYSISPSFIYRDLSLIRIKGFFEDPNVLGPYLIFPAAYLLSSSKWSISLRSSGLLVLLLATYLTYSRAAYAGMLLSLGMVVILTAMRDRALVSAMLSTIVTTVLLSFLYLDVLETRIISAEYFLTRLSLQDYDSSRFIHIALGWTEAAPHLFGLGPGKFAIDHGNNPHNLFIGRLTDAGWIPMILTLLAFTAATLRAGVIALSRKATPLSIALFSVLSSHLLISLVIHSHHWRHLWILIAMGLTLRAKRA